MYDVKFTDNSAQVLQKNTQAKEKCLTMFGIKWQELATKRITDVGAVDTGRMRDDAQFQVDLPNDQTIVGFTIKDPPYPIFVDLGTHKMPARPIMKPTTIDSRDKYEEVIKSVYQSAFGNA